MQGHHAISRWKCSLLPTDTTSSSDTYTVWKLNYIHKKGHDLPWYIFDSSLKLVLKTEGGKEDTLLQESSCKGKRNKQTPTKFKRQNKQWKTTVNLSAVSRQSLFFPLLFFCFFCFLLWSWHRLLHSFIKCLPSAHTQSKRVLSSASAATNGHSLQGWIDSLEKVHFQVPELHLNKLLWFYVWSKYKTFCSTEWHTR